MSQHLSEAKFFALIESPETALSDPHLATCAVCRDEVDQLRSSLRQFQAAAIGASTANAPVRLQRTGVRPAPRLFTLPRAAWATSLIAAMALGTTSVSMMHRVPTPKVDIATAHAGSANQTASATSPDDALLDDIDRDLSTSVPPSLAPLETTSSMLGETTTTSN